MGNLGTIELSPDCASFSVIWPIRLDLAWLRDVRGVKMTGHQSPWASYEGF